MRRSDFYTGTTMLCAVVSVHGMDNRWATATRVLATIGALFMAWRAER